MNPMDFRNRSVLVTGASSGLGRSIATILAREHGAHIVAVARRGERLRDLKRDLESRFGVKVEPIVADLAIDQDVERVLETATHDRQLYGAVLNAGTTHFGHYHELSWKDFEAMLHVNVTSVVRLATELVPHFEKDPAGGGILLVASLAGIVPVPYQTAYSATKAFIVHLGAGLEHELQGRNVSITTCAPGGIVTEMTAGRHFEALRGWSMTADAAAYEAIDAFRRRKAMCIPGVRNRMGNALMRLLPRRWVTAVMARTFRRALAAAEASGRSSDH